MDDEEPLMLLYLAPQSIVYSQWPASQLLYALPPRLCA